MSARLYKLIIPDKWFHWREKYTARELDWLIQLEVLPYIAHSIYAPNSLFRRLNV